MIDACLQNNAMFITPVPNSTHLTQPLDVAVFRPAKNHRKNILIRWRKESKTGGCIPKSHLPRLLSSSFALLSSESLQSGATSISPLDRNQVLKRLPSIMKEDEGNFGVLNDSLLQVLKEHRGIGVEKQKVSRKRRRKTTPGERMVSLDREDAPGSSKKNVNSLSKKKKKNKKYRKKNQLK